MPSNFSSSAEPGSQLPENERAELALSLIESLVYYGHASVDSVGPFLKKLKELYRSVSPIRSSTGADGSKCANSTLEALRRRATHHDGEAT
jgi:hypothetical protein